MKKAPPVRLSLRKLFIAMLAVGPISILPSPLLAAVPTSTPFSVVNGTVTWTGSGNLGTVNATTDRAILAWNTGSTPAALNIQQGDTFNFQLPAGGAILNKVGYTSTGAIGTPDTATINGNLQSNGRVFILANGNIQIGGGAQISTQGLYLSTLAEADNFNFLALGNLAFTGTSTGSIVIGGSNPQQTVPNTSQVNNVGDLGAWAGAITVNNLLVTGNMIVNQKSNSALSLTGAGGLTQVNGNLTATTAGGTIGQGTSALIVGNVTSLNTGGNFAVTLNNAANNFNTVTANTGALTLNDVGGIVLGNSTVASDLSVTTTGDIFTSGAVAVAGNAALVSNGGGVNFGNNSTVVGVLSATAASGNITINTAGNLTTGAITVGGALSIGAITVTNGGTGYTGVPTVTLTGGGGTGATATATVNTSGVVTGIQITNVGVGYTSAPSVVLSGGGTNPATFATATASISTGVNTITIPAASGGAGYSTAPSVTILGGGGTGATATAVITNGVVTGIGITNSGTGYTSTPTITFSTVSGTTQTANATAATVALVPTALASVTGTTTVGAGYTVAPTVTIINAGGTGATATAVVNTSTGTVTSVALTNAGTGFTAAPTVSLLGGGSNPVTVAAATAPTLTVNGNVVITTTGTETVNGNITGNLVTITAGAVATSNTGFGGGAQPLVFSANTTSITATTGNVVLPSISANRVLVTTNNGTISQFNNGTTSSTITTTNTTAPSTFNAGLTGNINLTNNNAFGANSSLELRGGQASVSTTRNITISGATIAGNLTVNTVNSTFAGAQVTLGAGGGSAGTAVNVGGNVNVNTNNSNVQDDTAADLTVTGALNINTGGNGLAANGGGIWTVAVSNGGSGYTSLPSITFGGGGGGGATATATINTNGNITGINITNVGTTGYTSIPSITITGGGGTNVVATVAAIGPGGDVTFTAGTAGVGGSGRYGQFNVVGRNVNLGENTTLNIGNITALSLTGNSANADLLISGSVFTFGSMSARASSGAITEIGSGAVNVGSSTWNSSNSFGTNLSNSSNIFAGTATITNGGTNIIVSGSSITFTPGNVTGGSLTVNTVNSGTTATFANGNATDVRINAAGPVVLNQALVRNLTINTTDTSTNSVMANGGNLTANGTVTITTSGGILINNTQSNITGPVVLSNVAGNATVYSTRNLTISGNVVGTLTALAGVANRTIGAGDPGNTFANPWNLVLGNLNVGSLNAAAMNGGTVPLTVSGSITSNGATQTQTVSAVNILNGGTGYTAAPTVTITGAGTAAATATISTNGVVTGITITNVGAGFTGTPTVSLSAVPGSTAASVSLTTSPFVGALNFVATEGNSGNITQLSGSRIHVENVANFATFGGNIVVANNGNSAGRVQLSTGGGTGIAGPGNITYVEDPTVKLGVVATSANATLTSRFGSILEDSAGALINVGGVLTLNAPNGSIILGNATGLTQGTIATTNVTATGSVALQSAGDLALGQMAANSLTVTANSINQSGPLNIFGVSTFTANNGITLTNAANNFGPLVLTTRNLNSSIAVTEGSTLNLRAVSMPGGGNGTFTATSVSGDIIDTGLGGVRLGGAAGTPPTFGSGVVTLTATNGNIIIDDPTSDILTTGGVAFNGKNVTLSVIGSTGSSLILGANGTSSVATGNLTASSALGNIGNGGRFTVGGVAFFQTGSGNITIDQPNVGFGSLLFRGNQVRIAEAGNMDILTGSSAVGPAQLVSGGSINVVVSNNGSSVTFGSTVAFQATGDINLKLTQVVGTLSLSHTGTANLSLLSKSADLSGRDPIDLGTGPYIPPAQ